jgi:hypothetical protein
MQLGFDPVVDLGLREAPLAADLVTGQAAAPTPPGWKD